LAFEAQYLRMLCQYAKQKVIAIVANPRFLLSVGALRKCYSQNVSAQVFNTNTANAGISGASWTLGVTATYGSKGRLVLGGRSGQSGA